MRYADRITFVVEAADEVYNPETGEYEGGEPVKEMLPCNISPLGINRTVQMFGAVDVSIEIARLQQPYKKDFDYVEVGGKRRGIKQHVPHRSGSVFYLEGVN